MANEPENPFLPDKGMMIAQALMSMGAGISNAAQRNQPFYMGLSEGAQHLSNSTIAAQQRAMQYEQWRKNYEMQADYKRMQEQHIGLQSKVLDQQLGINKQLAGMIPGMAGGDAQPPVPGIRAPQPPLMGPSPNNIGNVRPVGGGPDSGFQQPPDFDSGVALTVKNARAYPASFNNGQPMNLMQIGEKWAPKGDGANDPKAWAFNVSRFGGLDPNQPLDLNDPATAAKFARGVHGAEHGPQGIKPPEAYLPGVQAALQPQGQPGTPPGQPQLPGAPPDPTRYAPFSLSPMFKGYGEAFTARDKQQFDYQKWLYDKQVDQQKTQRESANAAVTIDPRTGQPVVNPMVPQAKAAAAGAELTAKEQARLGAIYPPGWENMKGDELRTKLPPHVRGIVDDLVNGDLALSDLPQRVSASGLEPQKIDFVSLAKQVGGDKFSVRLGEQRKQFEQHITDPNNPLGATRFSVNTALQHLDQYQDLVQALGNRDTPLVNKFLSSWNTQQGNPKFTNAEALQHHLATEVARVVKGGNQLNESDVESGMHNLSTAGSWDQAKGTLNVWRHAMQARINTIYDAAEAVGIPKEKAHSYLGKSAREALEHFDKVQGEGNKPAPSQTGGQKMTPEQAAKLPPGTAFMGMDGVMRVRR